MKSGWCSRLLLLGLLLAFFCAGCTPVHGRIDFTREQPLADDGGSAEQAEESRPLRVAFASVISPRDTRAPYQKIVDVLSEEMQRPVVLLQRKTYEELNQLVADGEVDVAFLSTGAYAAYRGLQPVELLAMTSTNGSVLYQTYILVPVDSPVRDFHDLANRVFAFTDPLSYSGRMAVENQLFSLQVTPEMYFKRCIYTFNHDKSIWAVAHHLADGASVDSQIYDYAVRTNPQLTDQVRILAALPPAPTGPVVMRSDLSTGDKEHLRQVFYHMHERPELQEALQQVMIDSFVPPQEELYAPLRQKYAMRH